MFRVLCTLASELLQLECILISNSSHCSMHTRLNWPIKGEINYQSERPSHHYTEMLKIQPHAVLED